MPRGMMAIPSRLLSKASKESLDPSWMQATFSDLWENNAKSFSNQEAVVDSKRRLTWSEANQWVNQIAYGLVRLGVRRDDCVVIQLPNCVELPLLRVACERAGLLCFPISRVLRGREVEYVLKKVGAKAYIALRKFRDFDYFNMIREIREHVVIDHVIMVGEDIPEGTIALESFLSDKKEDDTYRKTFQDIQCRPEEFSLITHTTGSTAFPKFVENPIFSRMELAKAQSERLALTSSDITGTFSPNAGGPNTISYFASPLAGAKIVMLEHFDPEEAMKRIERERITVLPVVPAMVLMLMQHPRFKEFNLRSLRVIVSGGGIFNYHDARKAEEALGCPIVQLYGSVDSGIGVMSYLTDSKEDRLGTVGKPLGNCQVKVIKEDGSAVFPGMEGDVLMRSPDCYSGYFKDPETNQATWDNDGWFRMEDIGKLDHDGNLIILGRKKELINRGGQKIIPGEVEEIISQYEKVAHVAVIGMPDKIMGEKICGYIVPKKDAHITLEEINEFLKTHRIAFFKLLDRLEIVSELPLVGGKIDKKRLSEILYQKLDTAKWLS